MIFTPCTLLGVSAKINASNVVVMASLGATHPAEEALRSVRASAVVATGFIYVIGTLEGAQKVGLTTDPKGRLVTLQTGCPNDLLIHVAVRVPFDDAHTIERRAHPLLERSRVRNEWFATTPEVAIEVVMAAAKRPPIAASTSLPPSPEALPLFSFKRVSGVLPSTPQPSRRPLWQAWWAILERR